jgi:hypothetical protein
MADDYKRGDKVKHKKTHLKGTITANVNGTIHVLDQKGTQAIWQIDDIERDDK